MQVGLVKPFYQDFLKITKEKQILVIKVYKFELE
jgi:hypothetical protein